MGATVRSCTKGVGKLSEPRCWRPAGRRSTTNGPREPRPDCPSGLARGQARRLETQRHPRVRKLKTEVVVMLPKRIMRKKKRKKRRKKKKSKEFFLLPAELVLDT